MPQSWTRKKRAMSDWEVTRHILMSDVKQARMERELRRKRMEQLDWLILVIYPLNLFSLVIIYIIL